MSIIISIIYGFVQGISEFLPISSSAHLALLPGFLKISDPGPFFDLSMHLGTGLSILVYFYKDILSIIREFFCWVTFKNKIPSPDQFLMKNFLLSTVSTFITVIFLKKLGFDDSRSVFLMGLNLISFGIIMGIADKFSPTKYIPLMQENQLKKSLVIGLCQGLAIIPGVSRLGATMTISRIFSLSRAESAKYSFLISVPVVFGGFLIKLKELNSSQELYILPAVCGGVISFLLGLITLSIFMKWIEKIGLVPFAVYRFLFGLYLLLGI